MIARSCRFPAEDARSFAIEVFAFAAAIQLAASLFLRLAERARPATLPQQMGITQNVGIGSAGLAAQILGSA
jgi:hypothetical protein